MSDAGWIHPGPISPLDCDQADCGWRAYGVPDKYHASALARHVAEAHQPTPAVSARDELRDCWLSDDRQRFDAAADAYRAEVLREAADIVGNDDDCACGGCDTCVPRKLADQLRRMADEAQS
jgi:hypothetical protein